MPRPQPLQFIAIILVLWLQLFIYISYADVGTAAWYAPPYLPTACYGNDQTQFPTSNLFGAAGDGVWDNGASCGRQYLVRCISASEPNTCLAGVTIQIKIVEYALQSASQPSDSGTTVVLSQAAFAAVTNSSSTASSINIEFQQV
ncbi:EG45-like domain containing protein [Mangifera indica]|uniref:EG45-like domain containing protein n=1 Tax=Mangifera indica TaxID=29780 RepID=UPI001CFB4CA2|nr:EG45-like domain containing protein [Mangifera indica]